MPMASLPAAQMRPLPSRATELRTIGCEPCGTGYAVAPWIANRSLGLMFGMLPRSPWTRTSPVPAGRWTWSHVVVALIGVATRVTVPDGAMSRIDALVAVISHSPTDPSLATTAGW
jgi:hypothetical protein